MNPERRSLLKSVLLAAGGGLLTSRAAAQSHLPGLPNVGVKADSGRRAPKAA